MKIGILTVQLESNYGGLLQAFALQKFLKNLGHDVLTIDKKPEKNLIATLLKKAQRIIRQRRSRWALHSHGRGAEPARQEQAQGRERSSLAKTSRSQRGRPEPATRFIRENIDLTEQLPPRQLLKKYNFDAIVVGSDQVWRRSKYRFLHPSGTPFLDFCANDTHLKRIAYAASFGIDSWLFTPAETKKFSALLKKFNAVSVREDSAVELCKKYLDVSADQLIDPTMLLQKEDYEKIIQADEARGLLKAREGSDRRVFSYVLDTSPAKASIATTVAETLGADLEKISPSQSEFAPVSAWLRGFRDASFVVTDSFHGTALSIIFNKPFLSIGNAARGMARFGSLLKIFGLEERLILVPEKISEDFGQKIRDLVCAAPDWGTVNARLEREQQKARDFLERALLK